jgi:glycosyltransferase involved in cell wall biosynthesis
VRVVPNYVADPGSASALGRGFLFAGRLSNEKGIGLLIDAWTRSGLGSETELTIVGDGPERRAVETAAARVPGIRCLGPVQAGHVQQLMRESRSVIVSSIWFEALPTVILEAYSCGRPVVATKCGALETLVPTDVGWLAPPDPASLADALTRSHNDPAAEAMGGRARDLYLARYAPEAGLDALLAAYRDLDLSATRGNPEVQSKAGP